MKILVDIQAAQTVSRHRGIGHYSLSLIKAMLELPHQHEIFIALSQLQPDTILPLRKIFSDVLPQSHILTWDALPSTAQGAPINHNRAHISEGLRESFLAYHKPDVVHVSSLFEGFVDDAVTSINDFEQIPTAMTFYDLIPLRYREHYLDSHLLMKKWYQEKLRHMKQANLWLSISEASRKDAIDFLQLPQDWIVNISAAISDFWKIIDITEHERKLLISKYQFKKKFIMCTTSMDFHKNVSNLIKAYAQLPKKVRSLYSLTIVGNAADGEQKKYQEMGLNLGLKKNDVVFTGYVPDEELIKLYNMCSLFICPSLCEGFGLPVLEAMSCGAAVIASNTSSLPEAVGYSEALFNPYHVDEMSQKMLEVLTNKNFHQALKTHGAKQIKNFSWKNSAKKTLEAFERLHEFQKEKNITFIQVDKRQKLAFYSALEFLNQSSLLNALSAYYQIDIIGKGEHTLEWFEKNFYQYEGRILYVIGNAKAYAPAASLIEKIPGILVWKDFFVGEIYSDRKNIINNIYESHGYSALVKINDMEEESWINHFPINFKLLRFASGHIFLNDSYQELLKTWYGNAAQRDCFATLAMTEPREVAKKIEYFVENNIWGRQIKLFQQLKNRKIIKQKNILDMAQASANNIPALRQKQILYDISELIKHDARSGVQRVVRAYMNEFLKNSPENYRFEPVYAKDEEGVYYYARSFTADLLGHQNIEFKDEKMEVYSEDVFLSVDLIALGLERRKPQYEEWKQKGVFLYFMVYDLLPVLYPQYFLDGMSNAIMAWLQCIMSVADGCICISRTVANELTELLSHQKKSCNIHAVHLGADIQSSFPSQGVSEKYASILQKIDTMLTVLTIGTIEPRKGYEQALKAFEILWKKNIPVNWIIVGKEGWKSEKVIEKLRKHPQKNKQLFWLENASDELLLLLYKQVHGCFIPSFGEGFGLPLIEAAQHKLPILARDIPVFREIAQEHAMYFSASNAAGLSEELSVWIEKLKTKNAISSDNLPWLTWKESAKQLLDIILPV